MAKVEPPPKPAQPAKDPPEEQPVPQVQQQKHVSLDPDLPEWYVTELIRKIYMYWEEPSRPPGGQKNIRATVYFEILRNGHIRKGSLRLERESSYAALDSSALSAVREVPFFPPLEDYPKEAIQVRANFGFPD